MFIGRSFWKRLAKMDINIEGPNLWIWKPILNESKIVRVVYNHLNRSIDLEDNWNRWKVLWKLEVAPWVKLFFWGLLHDKLPAIAYSSRLNIGPSLPCAFCGLALETDEDFLWDRSKSRACWNLVDAYIGTRIGILQFFTSKDWLL